MHRIAVLVMFAAATLFSATAQAPVSRAVVRASGQAVVTAQPDRAIINVGVVTKAPTADQAASANARQVEEVLTQLRRLLGSDAEIRTINYSLTPNYIHRTGQPPVLDGYTANNTVEVTVEDLSRIGRVIDTASQAGATNLHGLRFTVKDPEPLRARALARAAAQARSHAEAIAAGLGRQIGEVLVAQEGGGQPIVAYETRELTGAAQTPIETGLVEVRATVTVEVELL